MVQAWPSLARSAHSEEARVEVERGLRSRLTAGTAVTRGGHGRRSSQFLLKQRPPVRSLTVARTLTAAAAGSGHGHLISEPPRARTRRIDVRREAIERQDGAARRSGTALAATAQGMTFAS